mmetsp:Transcript_5375/g.9331  ORF Transcript_5375/g.9331 Transcript_5375/m.9331 type:complete len:293 (-) Transcript_5375:830-1708(-)
MLMMMIVFAIFIVVVVVVVVVIVCCSCCSQDLEKLFGFCFEFGVCSDTNIQCRIDYILGTQFLGTSTSIVGSTAQTPQTLGRQTSIVRLLGSLAQLRNQCRQHLLTRQILRFIHKRSGNIIRRLRTHNSSSSNGSSSGSSSRGFLGSLFGILFMTFVVLNDIECVGENRQGQVVQNTEVFLFLVLTTLELIIIVIFVGIGRVVLIVSFAKGLFVPNTSELNQGQYRFSDFLKGSFVKHNALALKRLWDGTLGSPQQNNSTCNESSGVACLARVREETETLESQLSSIHPFFH